MANLQLRRGLEANRTSIVPVDGELIYTTDTNKLYAGDSSTPGGIEVSGGGVGISGYSGISGATGSNGSIGFSGYSGEMGTSGYSGEVGTSGYSGEMGTSGYSGEMGTSGYSGEVGTSGYSGEVGTSGYSGISFSIPGPYADDSAAATAGVLVGQPYYKSDGFVVVRLV
jgi:hypothetical protein